MVIERTQRSDWWVEEALKLGYKLASRERLKQYQEGIEKRNNAPGWEKQSED